MTIEELKNYKKLQQAVRYWQKELLEHAAQSYVNSPQLTGQPSGSSIADPTGRRAMATAAIVERIRRLQEEEHREMQRIMDWIEGIDDPMVQAIMYARYIKGYSWTTVAMKLGGGNTASGVRQIHSRYLSHLSQITMI